MGRKSREKKEGRKAPEGKPGVGRHVALAAVAVAAVALGVMTWNPESPAPTPEPAAREAAPARRPPAPPPARADVEEEGDAPEALRALIGQWVRPDGGYVLAVTDIAEDGTAQARYLNPRPINVGRAEAKLEEGVPSLFVELRDRNYPGSTYTLTYDRKADQLVGIYYQATQRASYDVVFVRRP